MTTEDERALMRTIGQALTEAEFHFEKAQAELAAVRSAYEQLVEAQS